MNSNWLPGFTTTIIYAVIINFQAEYVSGVSIIVQARAYSITKYEQTNCYGQLLSPSNLTSFPSHLIQECSKSIANSANEDLAESFWNLYFCITKNVISGEIDVLTLKQFAEHVTINYPETSKTAIINAIDGLSLKIDEKLQGMERLKKIRGYYYDIEESICRRLTAISLRSSTPGCDYRTRNIFEVIRGMGMCCRNKTVPINVAFVHGNISNNDYIICHKELMSSIGTIIKENKTTNSRIFGDMCRGPCMLLGLGLISKSEITAPPNFSSLIDKFTPSFLSEKHKYEILGQLHMRTKGGKIAANSTTSQSELISEIEKLTMEYVNSSYEQKVVPPTEGAINAASTSKAIYTTCIAQTWIHVHIQRILQMMCTNLK